MLEEIRFGIREIMRPAILAILIMCATLLAIAGPFGTYASYEFGHRLAYWLMVTVVSSLMGRLALAFAVVWFGERHPLVLDIFATLLLTVVFTPALYLMTVGILSTDPDSGPTLLKLMGYVLPIGLAVYTGRRLIPGLEKVNYLPDAKPPPRLLRRLPNTSDQTVLRLTSDDHFVEIVSPKNTHRVRLRFSDAIDEMDGIEGFCTHRSHWVARDAIVGSERENGKLFVVLRNGDRVPVSRKYKPQLEEAGLL